MATDTAKYKAQLEEILTRVTEELAAIGIHDPKNPQNWIAVPDGVETTIADPNVAADRVEEWDERRSTLAELETRYNNVNRALQKIESGTFGICEISGEEIEADRLDANPAARTCKTHIEDEANLPK